MRVVQFLNFGAGAYPTAQKTEFAVTHFFHSDFSHFSLAAQRDHILCTLTTFIVSMKRQSLSRKCKNPLGRVNRIEESDSSDSSSSKQIGETSDIETANISAPLNHDALRDKENETSRFRRTYISNDTTNLGVILGQDLKDSKRSSENAELVRIHNQSQSFTRFEYKRIETIEKGTDMSGRTCIPYAKLPPSLTNDVLRERDCIRPRAFSYQESEDYIELVIAAQGKRNDDDVNLSHNPISILEPDQRDNNRLELFSSLGSAFHSPRRS